MDGNIEMKIKDFKEEAAESILLDSTLSRSSQNIYVQNIPMRMTLSVVKIGSVRTVKLFLEFCEIISGLEISAYFAVEICEQLISKTKELIKHDELSENGFEIISMPYLEFEEFLNANGGLNISLLISTEPIEENFIPELDGRLCKKGHLNPKLSLEFLEVMGQFTKRCKFYVDGCGKELKICELKLHEDKCSYRPVICPICQRYSPFQSFSNHFLLHHSDTESFRFEKLEFKTNYNSLKKYKLSCKKINAFNNVFFYVQAVGKNFVYQWIYLLGFEEECENFEFEINSVFSDKKIKFESKVKPMTMLNDDIIEDGNCSICPMNQAEKIVSYEILLKNLTKETKKETAESEIANKENENDDSDESGISDQEDDQSENSGAKSRPKLRLKFQAAV